MDFLPPLQGLLRRPPCRLRGRGCGFAKVQSVFGRDWPAPIAGAELPGQALEIESESRAARRASTSQSLIAAIVVGQTSDHEESNSKRRLSRALGKDATEGPSTPFGSLSDDSISSQAGLIRERERERLRALHLSLLIPSADTLGSNLWRRSRARGFRGSAGRYARALHERQTRCANRWRTSRTVRRILCRVVHSCLRDQSVVRNSRAKFDVFRCHLTWE